MIAPLSVAMWTTLLHTIRPAASLGCQRSLSGPSGAGMTTSFCLGWVRHKRVNPLREAEALGTMVLLCSAAAHVKRTAAADSKQWLCRGATMPLLTYSRPCRHRSPSEALRCGARKSASTAQRTNHCSSTPQLSPTGPRYSSQLDRTVVVYA
jgi:hypothetical protein